MPHWTNPGKVVRAHDPYDELALRRERRAVEQMDRVKEAAAKAVAARHPSAYALWALMDIKPERAESSELREGVPPHLNGAI